jgi:hypothetical protein
MPANGQNRPSPACHDRRLLGSPVAEFSTTAQSHIADRSSSKKLLAIKLNPEMREICQPGGSASSASTKIAIAATVM